MNVYVASSWRNPIQPSVVAALRNAGHVVYDFRHPAPGDDGFHWSEIDAEWDANVFREVITGDDQRVAEGFGRDMAALRTCDVCVLVLPCGRSAHTEAGFAAGLGKPTILLLADGEPELMYRLFDHLCVSLGEVLEALEFERRRKLIPPDRSTRGGERR